MLNKMVFLVLYTAEKEISKVFLKMTQIMLSRRVLVWKKKIDNFFLSVLLDKWIKQFNTFGRHRAVEADTPWPVLGDNDTLV